MKIDQFYWLKMGHKFDWKRGPKTTQKGVPNDPFGGTPQNGHFGVTWAPPLPPPNLTRGYVRSFTGPPLFKRRGGDPPRTPIWGVPPKTVILDPPKTIEKWSFFNDKLDQKWQCFMDWLNRLINWIDNCIDLLNEWID